MPCSIRWVFLCAALTGAGLACGAGSSAESTEALAIVSDRHLDLEVRQVRASNLFRLLAEVTHTTVRTDACVDRQPVDVRFHNAPARLIFAALGEQLGLAFRRDGDVLHVRCES